MQDGEGEEHVVNLLPFWENQIIRIREAFGREMMLDPAHPVKDEVIYVKSVDGSPPDPTFESVMSYTFGDDPTEFHARVHGGDTPARIREGLKRLHPDKNLGTMMLGDAEFENNDAVGEWFARTGTSDWRVKWKSETPSQKFWLWTPRETKDLGNKDLEGRTQEEIWKVLFILR
jgi:hypothetical protein